MKKSVTFLVLLLILISGCVTSKNDYSNGDTLKENMDQSNEEQETKEKWENGGIVISGKYADADIINLENGNFRIYYSLEPEAQGFNGQVYSAKSSDGITWEKESNERLTEATFPSILKLSDGSYRMYFQNQEAIKSAVSSDGITWKKEDGIRIDTANTIGLNLENVAAPTVMKIGEEYVMVYRGTLNERYSNEVPNSNTQLFLWATSTDGLNFNKEGIALDSRNNEFYGLLDGPELVEWDDGSIRLYFWSYKGVYYITYNNGIFSQDAQLEFSLPSDNPMVKFPPNPPSDPTLTKINGKWYLYYGQHTQGIFYATLK